MNIIILMNIIRLYWFLLIVYLQTLSLYFVVGAAVRFSPCGSAVDKFYKITQSQRQCSHPVQAVQD